MKQAMIDMSEDGFTSFIFALDRVNIFFTIILKAFLAARGHSRDIHIYVMLASRVVEIDLRDIDYEVCDDQYLVQITLEQVGGALFPMYNPTNRLLSLSSALITYFDSERSNFANISNYIYTNRIPFININI